MKASLRRDVLLLLLVLGASCDALWAPFVEVPSPTSCASDQDCVPSVLKFCDKEKGVCRGCQMDQECTARSMNEPFCDLTIGGLCSSHCNQSTQCVALDSTKPTCDTGTCRGCKLDRECVDPTRPFCDHGLCRGCTDEAECVTKKGEASPICAGTAPTKQCRGCRANSECTSDLCVVENGSLGESGKPTGACVPEEQVLYVQLRMSCAGESGGKTTPYCQIATAVQNLGNKKFILVRASQNGEYAGFTVSSGKFAVIGPGADPTLNGTEWETAAASAPVNAVKVQGSADVTLDGLKFGSTSNALECNDNTNPTPTVTLRRSLVQGGQAGVLAVLCKQLTVDRSKITNTATGIRISTVSAVSYRIVNSLLTANTGGPGVFIGSSAVGTFEFNTVTENGMVGQNGGGVTCESGGNAKKIASSIVTDNKTNGMPGTRSQFVGACELDNVAVGTGDTFTTGSGIKTMPAEFMLPSYKLQAGSAANRACCIDQTSAGPPTDFFGSRRPEPSSTKTPASTRYTLGFHEVE